MKSRAFALQIRLHPRLVQALEELAAEELVDRNTIIRQLLIKGLRQRGVVTKEEGSLLPSQPSEPRKAAKAA